MPSAVSAAPYTLLQTTGQQECGSQCPADLALHASCWPKPNARLGDSPSPGRACLSLAQCVLHSGGCGCCLRRCALPPLLDRGISCATMACWVETALPAHSRMLSTCLLALSPAVRWVNSNREALTNVVKSKMAQLAGAKVRLQIPLQTAKHMGGSTLCMGAPPACPADSTYTL